MKTEQKMNLKNKKITMATVKSFVKNADKLYVENLSSFDGMVDCVMPCQNSTMKEVSKENALGHNGAYIVGSSRDYFEYQYKEIESTSEFTFTGVTFHCMQEPIKYVGIKIYNSCGSAILWTTL